MDINYIEKGSGTPLILLHGNGEDSSYFSNQIVYFSKEYRVIAIDSRGHGKSERGEEPLSLKQFAKDLKAFMDEKGIEKANILGFSDGANVAILFALRYPKMVDRLILNGANLFPSGVKNRYQMPIEVGYIMTSVFAKRSEKAKEKNELLSLMVNEPRINPKRLKKLDMKTLVIVGKNDMIKESHTWLIYESLPNAELKVIDGNHFIAQKNPEEFNKAVEEFLKK